MSLILFQPFFPSATFHQQIQEFIEIQEIPRISKVLGTHWIVLESAWFVGFSGKSLPVLAA